jgi:hypothetical protein
MKKVILILLCTPLLFSCSGSDTKEKTSTNSETHQQKDDLIEQFTRDLDLNTEASNNKNWDAVIDMTYPKLFDLVTKEEFQGVLESMFEIFKDFQTSIISDVRHSYPVIDYEGDKFTKFSYDAEMMFTFFNSDDLDNILPGFIQEFGEDNIKIFQNTNSVAVNNEASMLAVLEENASKWTYLNWDDNIEQFLPSSVIDQLLK